MTSITIDKAPPTCYCVHWAHRTPTEMTSVLRSWGFVGIKSVETVGEPMQGNDARRAAYDMAKENDAVCFYQHNYDATVGKNAAVYKVVYEGFNGNPQAEDVGGGPDFDKYFIGRS